MKDFKAGLRILASLKLPPVSRSLRRNVTGPSPEDLLPGGAARREEYWENATNATLRWNVDPSMSELHNMRRPCFPKNGRSDQKQESRSPPPLLKQACGLPALGHHDPIW